MASGDTLAVFVPQSNEPPAADYGRLDTRDATFPHPIIDLALTEEAVFSGFMPGHYDGGGLTITLIYAMSSAEANDIKLETEIERWIDGTTNLDTDSFAAAQDTTDITVLGTAGLLDYIDSTHTSGAQMDSLAADEGFRLRVTRVAVVGTDAAGDLELRMVIVKET